MIRVLALLCALATAVQAKMMTHTDLAGLALNSDAVILADRTSPGHYKVVKALRGTASGELALDDQLYNIPASAAARCWVFIQGGRIASLRIVDGGKVFRFEQRNNPGGWDAVPQGADPEDQWRTTPQLDAAQFEPALLAAIARAETVKAAIAAKTTRAQLLAQLAPAGDARAQGFYVDAIAEAVENELARRGDWAGVVEATRHDHRGVAIPRFSDHAKELAAVAMDKTVDESLRAGAVRLVGEMFDLNVDLLPLATDDSALVRAAAIRAIVSRFGAMSSDAKEQKQITARKTAAMAAFAKLAKTEKSRPVLFELAAVVPIAGFVGGFSVVEDYVQAEVRCTGKAQPKAITAKKDGQPFKIEAFNLNVACGNGLGGGVPKPFPDGVYMLSAEVAVGNKVVDVPLGRFTAVGGEVTLAP